MVAAANYVPSGLKVMFLILTASLTLRLSRFFAVLAPGIAPAWVAAFVAQTSSSKSESNSSSSCYKRPPSFTFLELSLMSTPSSERFYVIANLLIIILLRTSYKQIFFELPPPITNSPLGLRSTVVKCLFFVEFLAEFLSSCRRPPCISFLYSINDLT